jgi:predicted TIM-barrel fold metal-dependent hydrolase
MGRVLRRNAVAAALLMLMPLQARGQQQPLPVIDMHLHARDAPESPRVLCLPVTVYGVEDPRCPEPMTSPPTDQAMVERTVEILERRNVIGVISGDTLDTVRRFIRASPDRLIPAYQLSFDDETLLAPETLRRHLEARDFEVLGEIESQYAGLPPGDPRLEPYWTLAEELDIPVALHLGEGYPGAPYLGSPRYRARLGSPLLLEEVLIRHPELRLYVMHFGSPLVDEMIAVLYTYPQVYVGIGGNTWPYPREFFYAQLEKLVNAGFGKRILFGSDQMVWPELLELSISIVEEAPFLSEEQKRDILYDNAARFLRLDDEEIARHHGR